MWNFHIQSPQKESIHFCRAKNQRSGAFVISIHCVNRSNNIEIVTSQLFQETVGIKEDVQLS